MSISSEITRISGNVSDALTAIGNKGVTVPSGSSSDDLATLISQIDSGSEWTSGVYMDADGYIRISPNAAAGGVMLENGFIVLSATQTALGTKSITANGTYNAASDSLGGYSQVTVNVPNSYAATDEGKVVSNGALVAQGSDIVTVNDTYDTTLISSLTVSVSGSSSLSDSITFSSQTNVKNYVVNVGGSFTHFVMYASSSPYGISGTRTFGGVIFDDTGANSKIAMWVSSNAGGTTSATTMWGTNAASTVTKSGNTIVFPSTATEVFPSGVTYVWFAW